MALTDEIDYPSRGDDAVKTMLIGGALVLAPSILSFVAFILIFTFILAPVGLLLLPFAFVPQILTQGYLVRVLDDTLDGGVEPPPWEEWADIAVDGLKFVAVSLVYSIPIFLGFLILGALALAGTSVGAGIGGDGGGAVAGISIVLTLVLSLVFVVLALAVGYVLPIAVCGWLQDDALGGAFDLDRIREVATTREYAVGWGAGVVTLLVGGGVAQVLFFLLVGFPLLFAAQVLAFRFFARGYADALDLDVAPAGATPTAAVAGTTATSVPDPDPTKTDTLGTTRPDDSTETTDASGPTEPSTEAEVEPEFSADPVDAESDTGTDDEADDDEEGVSTESDEASDAADESAADDDPSTRDRD